jgi:hypothetical protein
MRRGSHSRPAARFARRIRLCAQSALCDGRLIGLIHGDIMRLATFGLPAALAAVALAAPASAQAPSPWRIDTAASLVYQFSADLDIGGDVAITRGFGQVSLGYGFGPRTSVALALSAGFTDYDFGGGATLGGVEPWGRIDEYRISLPVRFGIADGIDGFVIPSVRWNGESGADSGDSRTEGVIAGASWRLSPSFAIGPGLGVFTELDDDTNVFPILVLDWDVTDRLNIGTGSGFGATQGPGLEASYRLDDAITLSAGFRYESVRFRLDSNGPTPNGIGETQTTPIYLQASWAPSPMMSVTAIAGVDVMGEVTLRDSQGSRIESRDVDPAPFVGLSGRLRF